jgi:hypothetical protein
MSAAFRKVAQDASPQPRRTSPRTVIRRGRRATNRARQRRGCEPTCRRELKTGVGLVFCKGPLSKRPAILRKILKLHNSDSPDRPLKQLLRDHELINSQQDPLIVTTST